MRFGLSDRVLSRIHEVFAQHAEVESVVLFGSRAKGTHHPGSDIDLALIGAHLAQPTANAIDDELDDLLLPYRFDVTRMSGITDKELLAHIARVSALIYQKSNSEKVSMQDIHESTSI